MAVPQILYSELSRSQRDYLAEMYMKHSPSSEEITMADAEIMASEFSHYVGRAFSSHDIFGLLRHTRSNRKLVVKSKGKQPPKPPSGNALRAEKMNGIRPTNGAN